MRKREIKLETGIILVAPPALIDPNFRRSVVLLCEHTAAGSFGLILNHKVTVGMAELIVDLSSLRDPVRVGGPVQLDTLHYLHRFGSEVSGSLEIVDGVYWGGELDDLQDVFQVTPPTSSVIRFFLGYAGWGEGQLEEEVNAGGWLLLPPSSDYVFSPDPDKLWRKAMISLGGDFALMANYPDDPIVN